MEFYTNNKDKALELARKQRKDGWKYDDIRSYFEATEGTMFAIWIVKTLKDEYKYSFDKMLADAILGRKISRSTTNTNK